MRIVSGIVLLVGWFIVSCSGPEEPSVADSGSDYFPLKRNLFSIYQVDSTVVSQNVETAFTFQLRVTVVDSFANDFGGYTYRLQREKRPNASAEWSPAGTWSAWKDDRQAVLSEGNTSIVKLQFPVSIGLKWNGNALNNQGGDEQCNGTSCDSYEVTLLEPDLVVTQADDPDVLVKQDVRAETYRKGVGLVASSYTVLNYCTASNCFGKQFVNSGLKYTLELIQSGPL